MLNQQIGQYKITKLLGEGGFAHVYLAEKGVLGRKVALKVLKEEFLSDSQIRGRFFEEAKSMFHLNHPNIVSLYDLVDERDLIAIELEYIEGENLRNYLKRMGVLSNDLILSLLNQMLDALNYIHQKGLIHRDIKPSNFIVSPKGIIKLTDFGIAKNTDRTKSEYTKTRTGIAMGTDKYMSPEQVINTKQVTFQSDFYSLGVVLWEMVTGLVPYDIKTQSEFEIHRKVVDEPLSLTNTQWDELIQSATLKDPKKRVFDLSLIRNETDAINAPTEDVFSTEDDEDTTNNKQLFSDFKIFILSIIFFTIIGAVFIYIVDNKNTLSKPPEIKPKTRTLTDTRDNKVYKIVEIGNQTWMAENLAYKPTSGNYWAYNNQSSNIAKYGYLYDWETACKVCPEGWDLPNDYEWTTLIDYLGGLHVAGTSMKSTSGWEDNGNGINLSGFLGLPGGYHYGNYTFSLIGEYGYWWSSTEKLINNAWYRRLNYDDGDVFRFNNAKDAGLSVRCLKD